jgi:MoxR-like ATPase
LTEPFFVLATQNPIEQEGTYPLPEAQLDRFMFNTFVDYPSAQEELEIVKRTTTDVTARVTPTLNAEEIIELQRIVRRVPVADHVARYALSLARLTRPGQPDAPDFIREYVSWGAGPRASQYLVLGAKARAVLHGRYCVAGEDIRAEAEGIKPDDVVRRLIELVGVEEEKAAGGGKLPQVFGTGGSGQT